MTVSQISALMQRVFVEERIPVGAAESLAKPYGLVIEHVVRARREHGASLVLGICGSQGSGKSTMTRVLEAALTEAHGYSVANLSLDDLYLSTADRARLAREVHPLLRTRGVPGTHRLEEGIALIDRLTSAKAGDRTRMPRFDKSQDEPRAASLCDEFQGRADVVILEGWCVGARPQADEALVEPVNELERTEDGQGRWRRYVNAQLAGPYASLFSRLHRLLMLRAPGFDVVLEWRRQQERKLAARLREGNAPPEGRAMTDAEVERFVMHYERLTRHVLAEMPSRANVVVQLDGERRILGVTRSS
jgi:D-glycerate 3-kinase